MRRRLLNLLTALSLLLCVAVCVLWVRSYWATDTVRFSGSRVVRIVITRGAAIVASRNVDMGAQDVSIEFGTNDRPWEPDYIREYSLFGSDKPLGPPPGPGWMAEPFDSFRAVHLGVVALACGVLPACRLVFDLARRRRRGLQSEPAAVRPLKRRLARAALIASWVGLAVALLGWIDSATWHFQSVCWRGGDVQLVSNWGRCELILYADWDDRYQEDEPAALPAAFHRRPDLTWHREWLHPSGRGHQGPPEGRQLVTWFNGGLNREGEGVFGPSSGTGLFEPAESDGSVATAGAPAAPSPVIGFSLHVPYWSVVLLVAVLPGTSLARTWWSSRRRHAGRCSRCGYDLRATPGRCPECGTPATTPA